MSPGWSLVIGTAELSADLSQSPAQGSVAPSPAPGAVSCRRRDGAIESAGSGLSILQRRRSSRGPPTAASAPRFLSTASDPAAGHRLPLRFFDSLAPEPALVMSPAAGSSILRHRTQSRAAGCRSDFSIPQHRIQLRTYIQSASVESVIKRRSASGGRRPSMIFFLECEFQKLKSKRN